MKQLNTYPLKFYMKPDRSRYTILYLNDYLHGMGGAERNLIQILDGIDKRKFSPIVCCLSGGKLASDLKEKGYEIYNLKVKRIYDLHGIQTLIWLIQLIRKKKVRLIVSYHESSDFLGLMAAKLSGVPIVSSRRDMGYKLKKKHIFLYRLCNKYFKRIIAVSDAVKRIIVAREKTPLEKIITIHNGVDANFFSRDHEKKRIKRSLGIHDHEYVVGMIAGFRKIKGHICFIKAAAEVVREIPNVKFLIIGKDYNEPGCSQKDLINIANKFGVREHLIFTGERKDIPELLSALDIVVNPSLSEGMSNTLLEAMAAGKTVIASNVGGNPEIIEDNETGFLFPPKDVQMLSTLIINSLKNLQKTALIGRKAQKMIKERHDLQLMCERNMALYMKCIGEGHGC